MTSESEQITADWASHPIEGYAVAAQEKGETGEFSAPLISHISANLYVGGCLDGHDLGDHFGYVFSMYPWEKYKVGPDTEHHEFRLYDSAEIPDEDLLNDLSNIIAAALETGKKVLVHCQAGLNRSNLLAALALRKYAGLTSEAAIALLRVKRSPMVLCNQAFEDYLLALDGDTPRRTSEQTEEHDAFCEFSGPYFADGPWTTCHCRERAADECEPDCEGCQTIATEEAAGDWGAEGLARAAERDPHAAALARIGELRSLLEAGTAGPWVAQEGIGGFWWIEQPNRSDIADLHANGRPAPDAALIVAAVNHLGPFLDAMEAVSALADEWERDRNNSTFSFTTREISGFHAAQLRKALALGIEVTS